LYGVFYQIMLFFVSTLNIYILNFLIKIKLCCGYNTIANWICALRIWLIKLCTMSRVLFVITLPTLVIQRKWYKNKNIIGDKTLSVVDVIMKLIFLWYKMWSSLYNIGTNLLNHKHNFIFFFLHKSIQSTYINYIFANEKRNLHFMR
jgi:hypothetical protein